MGLFDGLEGMVSDMAGNSQATASPLFQEALALIQQHPDGLSGLVQKFEAQSLGGVVQSWLSSGENQALSPDQLHQVLGGDVVRSLAAKVGVDPDQAASELTAMLPQLVGALTSGGATPQGGLVEEGMALLKGKLLG